ncbi:protein-cysteine N-palmitoyltransferase HHAT-like [Asterias amurensis]|uniref:protein-cysteine N-palmitoyltransferase HHAT-like n=1 Tax=Asterias amurensis TaxID=7602 RepID=UPI003AB4A14D
MAFHRNRGKKARDKEEEQENTSKLDKSSLHENKSAIQCPFSSTSRPELDGGRDPSNSKPSAPKKSEFQHAALPTMELYLYVAFIGFLLFYIQWHIHQISKENESQIGSYLSNSWPFIQHLKKDTSDYQWKFFTGAMTTPAVVGSFIAYVVMGQLVAFVAPKLRKPFMLFYSILIVYVGYGSHVLALLLVHAVMVYVVALTRKPILVWIVVVLQITSFSVQSLLDFQNQYITGLYSGMVCITTSNLRLLCFGLEFCRNTKPGKPSPRHYTFFDMLLYNFYLPVLAYGPVIGYDTFLSQINNKIKMFSWKELRYILKEFIRFLFWAFFAELFVHWLYIGALTNHRATRESLSALDISFLALYHLLFFQLKVLVLFSLPRVIALFDRIEAPINPICILSMHFFKDMWKYFDRGLNDMLTKYIYYPLGGSRHGILRQSFAAFMCFFFTAHWHGCSKSYYYWALLNWVGVQLESILLTFSANFMPLQRFQNGLSGAMLRRFHTACAVPNYLFLASANLVFVLGTTKTYYVVTTVYFGDWPWNFLLVLISFYCCIQVVTEMEKRIGKNRMLSKKYI